ncbi:MAG TPA: glucose 1-dehydrogenase [Malonomonas sp.]
MLTTIDGFSELRGKVVLVTGAGSGIGSAMAEAFARCGARLVMHCHRSGETAERRAAEFRQWGCEVLLVQGDFTQSGAVAAVIAAAHERFGRIDVLVNNAGSMVARRPISEVDDDFIDEVFNLNARSVVTACRCAVPGFIAQGGGVIINVSSISARTGGSAGSSIYSASKAFVSTLTRALARELAGDNIRVNAVSPGTFDTDFHQRYSSRKKLELTRQAIPQQRLGQPADCAGTVLYLACDALSGYLTGQVIELNGGQLMA